MKIQVRLFGTLGNDLPDHDPLKGITIEVPEDITITGLITHLNIDKTKVGITSVNGHLVYPGHVLKPGDAVRIFRPIFGG